ncbi:helix-turn-helix transcriptional regulator [Cohnella sp.]|uniref:helix-turn-helix transcriptional regulator n=1 Tax=Cohnella sp. TaxID=1883426 RepID=UPI003564A5BF
MSSKYPELDQVIMYIQNHLHEPISLSQLSHYAFYSPYHFIRIFKEQMGLTPQYYISSLRLQKAKELLLATPFPVREVANELGYQSLGTFTSRFSKSVGMTPSEFRSSGLHAEHHLRRLSEPAIWLPGHTTTLSLNDYIEGTVRSEIPFQGVVLVGLFRKPLPEGIPLYGTLARVNDSFRISGVKPGVYYLMATSVSWKSKANDILLPAYTLRTRSRAPIIIKPGECAHQQDVILYPPRLDDPPILISLTLLMQRLYRQFSSIGKHSN